MIDAEKRLSQILTEIGNVAPAILNERQQRLISGSIAKGYGYGGDKIVSEAFGMDPRTVSAGRKAIEAGRINDLDEDRVRQVGGGRKQAKELQPDLMKNIEEIVRITRMEILNRCYSGQVCHYGTYRKSLASGDSRQEKML